MHTSQILSIRTMHITFHFQVITTRILAIIQFYSSITSLNRSLPPLNMMGGIPHCIAARPMLGCIVASEAGHVSEPERTT